MQAALETIFAGKTRAEWAAIHEPPDACAAPVLSMSEAPDHPHNRARSTFVETDGIVQPGACPRFSATPCDPPTHGDAGRMTPQEALDRWAR